MVIEIRVSERNKNVTMNVPSTQFDSNEAKSAYQVSNNDIEYRSLSGKLKLESRQKEIDEQNITTVVDSFFVCMRVFVCFSS